MKIKIKEIEYFLTAYPTKMYLIPENPTTALSEVICKEESGVVKVIINVLGNGQVTPMKKTTISNRTYKDLAFELEKYFDFKEGVLEKWKNEK